MGLNVTVHGSEQLHFIMIYLRTKIRHLEIYLFPNALSNSELFISYIQKIFNPFISSIVLIFPVPDSSYLYIFPT